MRGWRRLIGFAAIALALLWIMRTPSRPTPLYPVQAAAPVTELGREFSQARCGSLSCTVEWEGSRLTVPPLSMFQAKTRPGGKMELPNPNAPKIANNGGVADAIVFLRGIDPKKSRSWDLPAVAVEVNAADMIVHFGETVGRFGVVRRGASVELVSREPAVHGIRGRDADFFTQMLFTPDEPVVRSMPTAGIVELSSGSWYFWMRGYLFVSDHPYAGLTDATGVVRFDDVPAGEYELVCWKANWRIARIERDPEWIFQTGIVFEPAVELTQRITIRARESTQSWFKLNAMQFTQRSSSH
jgi:hypothetical protein